MILAALMTCDAGDKLIESLLALLEHRISVVIIDNGSQVPVKQPGINVIRLEPGVGIIHGRNFGFSLRQSQYEGVLALADDIIVPRGNWEALLESTPDLVLAMRPADDVAFTQYRQSDDLIKYPDYIQGAPTSFQCVYFPSPVLEKIGYIDERYLWGDDGCMMMKHPHAVLRNFKIKSIEIPFRRMAPRYRALREFYEELWRPGKVEGKHWDQFPIRHTQEDFLREKAKKCPTIWTMQREEWSNYYDISLAIRLAFEEVWKDPTIDRMKLLLEIQARDKE